MVSIEKVIKKIKPDEIYNFADQDHVKWSFDIPFYSFNVTANAVFKILEIIKDYFLNSTAIIGSGFETNPEYIDHIRKHIPVISNNSEM